MSSSPGPSSTTTNEHEKATVVAIIPSLSPPLTGSATSATVVDIPPPLNDGIVSSDGGNGSSMKPKNTTKKNGKSLSRKNTNGSVETNGSSSHRSSSPTNSLKSSDRSKNSNNSDTISPKQTKKQVAKQKQKELKLKLKQNKKEHKNQQQQGEAMLHDVLTELDRERTTRAELEARVRLLEQDLYSAQRQQLASNQGPTRKEYIQLQTEKDGYLQLLDALLKDNKPAFQSAMSDETNSQQQQHQQTLPLHVLRMMEVIPWDPRAKPHLFGEEQLYEWQLYSTGDKSWKIKNLRHFPHTTKFRQLPCTIPKPNFVVGEAPTSSSPPKGNCVLTNIEVTHLLNIDQGYPLPTDGGVWKWVGGWRIDKNQNTDNDGWSYSNSRNINDESSYYDQLRMPTKGQANLLKRRRKWTRLRALVDYPQASESTVEYLKLVAANAELDISVEKLSSQLVETKMNLTSLEADHLTLKEETTRKIKLLEKDVKDKNRIIESLSIEDPSTAAAIAGTVAAKDSVKELRSVVTQWVTNKVSNKQQTVGNSHGSDENDGENNAVTSDEVENDHLGTSKRSTTTTKDRTTTAKPQDSSIKDTNSTKQLVDSLKEKGGGILGKGGDLFDKFKKSGAEDLLDKIKQKGEEFKKSGAADDLLEKLKQNKPGFLISSQATTAKGQDYLLKDDGDKEEKELESTVPTSSNDSSHETPGGKSIKATFNTNNRFDLPSGSTNPFDD